MTAPLQIACLGLEAEALLKASAFGPFDVHTRPTLDALASADVDAMLIASDQPDEVAAWLALPAMALQTALLVLLPNPGSAVTVALLQAGVQEVLPRALLDSPGAADRLGAALRQAIERKRLDAATRRAYATDLSTGLPHHPQLLEHMTHLLALREREPAPMALIALRIGGLAATEAALGAESANVLRRKAAVRLRSALRASDVVASKLAHALARPFSVAGRDQGLVVSVGLASYPEHGKDADALMRRALSQAAQHATVGEGTVAQAADRGPAAAANDA